MSIISQTTWEKFTQEEKGKVIKLFNAQPESYDVDTEYKEGHFDGTICALENLFGKENLQPKPLTYDDVVNGLVVNTDSDNLGIMMFVSEYNYRGLPKDDVFSVKQAEKLIAINRLLNVAKFLNGDWKPDWENRGERKWYLSSDGNKININYVIGDNSSIVYFRTEELAEQAIQILGEDTVRLALTNDF